MIFRFIKEKQPRLSEKQFSQLNSHPPAPAKFPGRSVKVLSFEPQSDKGLFFFNQIVGSAQNPVSLFNNREMIAQLQVFCRLVVVSCCNLSTAAFYLP